VTIPAIPPKVVEANGIPIALHDVGEGPAVVLLHGFPSLAYAWRRQIPALAGAGWRVIAPDLRGSGRTGPHGEVGAYSLRNLSRDVLGVLDALGVGRAVMVGHDFGGVLAWALGRDHADRVAGVISLNTPYTRRTELDLAETLRKYRGETNYMVVFQTPGPGEAILERDVAETFAGMMRRPAMKLDAFHADERLRAMPVTVFGHEPALMGEAVIDEAELQVYVEAFRRTGFGPGINWYRNFRTNWLDTAGTRDVVEAPALMVVTSDDIFLPPETTRGMERHIPDLERAFIEDCGHWTQQEQPERTGAVILEWLERRMRPILGR
jgi:pimeloyl-ACP methyl ester carboxylesterase